MPRLTDPDNGVTVQVGDDYAKELTANGWKPAEGESKPAAKAPARKTAAKSDD